MSDVSTSAGAIIYIGAAAPSAFDKAGYEAVTWTEVGEVSNIDGDLGKVFSLSTFNLLKEAGVVKRKGSYNNGSITVQYGYHRTDTGQAAVVAAAGIQTTLPFKIALGDQETTQIYFMALTMGDPINIGGSDDFITSTVTLEIDSESDVLKEVAPV
ncbi:MAG: hypothetical protein COA78_06955 [Blastopirellula sp.]|nr:MAG: hypothetical protein COA78_06955 [Blastopirellula sp.]